MSSSVSQAAAEVLREVEVALATDAPFGGWIQEEGERVLDQCQAIVRLSSAGDVSRALGGSSVAEFLGESWLEVHSKVYAAVERLQALLVASDI